MTDHSSNNRQVMTAVADSEPTRWQVCLRHGLTAAMLTCFALAGWQWTQGSSAKHHQAAAATVSRPQPSKVIATSTTAPSVQPPTTTSEPPRYITKNIEDIQSGDYVLAREEHGDKIALRRVVEAYRRTSYHLRHLTFESEDGSTQTLQTTDEHPFWHAGREEWIEAGDLLIGDPVPSPTGHIQTLITTRRTEHPEGIAVFNFQVAQWHTYFVTARVSELPLLAHNSKCPHVDGGVATIDQALDGATSYLGPKYRSLPNGRYLSHDGMRQVRMGHDELKDIANQHIHFEAFDIPWDVGGKVIESGITRLIP